MDIAWACGRILLAAGAFDPTASAVGWEGPMRIDRRRFIHTSAAAVAGALNRRTLWAVTFDFRRQAARHECALRGQAPMVSASAPGSRMPSGVLAGVTSPSASMDSSGGASDVSTTILPSLAVA